MVPHVTKDRVRLWNTKSKHRRNRSARENALQESLQELNFLELTVESEKLQIRTIRIWYVAELR